MFGEGIGHALQYYLPNDLQFCTICPMTSSAALASGLLGLAALGGAAAAGRAVARRNRTYLPGGIAVALDGPHDPLTAALRQGLAGLEVGVRLDAQWRLRLTGGPHVDDPHRTLERMVIEPLAQRVTASEHGRVYPGWSEPFQLLLRLDRAEAGVAAHVALEALLKTHAELFTRCTADQVTPGAVTVVLTGHGWPRESLVDAYERSAFLEGHVDSPCGPPSLVPLVYESLAERLGWHARGRGRVLPAEARHIVRSLVLQAHAEGRRLRFVDVPERPAAVRLALWRELRAVGVDYHSSRPPPRSPGSCVARFGWARRDRRHAAPRSRYAIT